MTLAGATTQNVISQSRITQLPEEILLEIFLWLCVPYDPYNYDPTLPLHSTPVASVCSFWRRVAISSPVLWSTIICSCYIPADAEKCLKRLQSMLLRSGEAPLCLYLTIWASIDASVVEEISSLVRPALYRCHTLILFVSSCASPSQFLPLPKPMAQLKHLEVHHEPWFSVGGFTELFEVGETECKLETLIIREVSWVKSTISFPGGNRPSCHLKNIPASGLKNLVFTTPHSSVEVIELLSRCAVLENLHLQDLEDWSGVENTPQLALAKLGTLTIRHGDFNAIVHVVVMEALHSLTLACDCLNNFYDQADILTQMLGFASLPRLKNLSLTGYSLATPTEGSLAEILATFPTIESLRLNSFYGSKFLIPILSTDGVPTLLLPNLKLLHLENIRDPDALSPKFLAQTLAARPGLSIYVDVHLCSSIEDISAWKQQLAEYGDLPFLTVRYPRWADQVEWDPSCSSVS